MKLLSFLILMSTTLFGMEKLPNSMSTSEKLALLDAVAMGNFEIHATYIQFSDCYKPDTTYLKSNKEVHTYLKDLIANTVVNTTFSHRYANRFDKFVQENPNFPINGGTDEKIQEFFSCYSYEFISNIVDLSGNNKKDWENFLDALKNNDSASLINAKKMIKVKKNIS